MLGTDTESKSGEHSHDMSRHPQKGSRRNAHRFVAIAALVITLLAITMPATVVAQTCIEDGGTAQCTGPEVGQYMYHAGSSSWNPFNNQPVQSEAVGAAGLLNYAFNPHNACDAHIENPAWLSTEGLVGYGNRTAGNVASSYYGSDTGDYIEQQWYLSVESKQWKLTVRVKGTQSTTTNPPCGMYFWSGNLGITRQRSVNCPYGFSANTNSPLWAYCVRQTPLTIDPPKSLGRCKDCDLTAGNPINVATGNKYQEELDYRGSGPFALEYVRRYNSLAYDTVYYGPDYFTNSPMWRGTYDRAVLFSDHPRFPIVRVHRPDGRVLQFKQSGTQWVADADIVERLGRLVDTSGEPTGWTLATADDELETYDVSGRLLSIRNRSGIVHTLTYDTGGRLIAVTHSFGQQLAFTYNANMQLATVTVPDGGVISYAYGNYQNLTSVTYPDGKVRTYHYENGSAPRGLTGITDESAVRFATVSYAGSGVNTKATLTTHAGGANQYTVAYTSATRSTVTDPRGTVRTIDYTPIGKSPRATAISQSCNGCGSGTKSKTFDANGNVATRTDFNNNQTNYSHDLARNLEALRTEAYGTPKARTITTQWHSIYRLPLQIDEPGKRTTLTYDPSGNVLTKTVLDTTSSESRTWTYTYDSVGQVLTADGPRTDVSDVTTYTYYSCTTGYQCGQLNTITNALGHVTTYNTYNAHGQPLTITDPNGVVTTLTYDLRQRLTSRTVGIEQTTFEYWPTGLLNKATLPDGSYLQYTYDAAHRLTGINDADNNHIAYTLDAMGNRTTESTLDPSNALMQTRTRMFNTLNQLWKEIGAAGTPAVTTQFSYDNNGNQTSINAPLSRTTGQTYDELNRLTTVTDPGSGVTTYGYNALDQLISVTDPRSKVTSYTYNALGDLTQQASPDTATTLHTYDDAGNLKTTTDARNKTGTYSYDALNRITGIVYPDQTISYVYDSGTNQAGRLTQLTDGSGSIAWMYDALGRATLRQQTTGSVSKSVGYSYNSAGQLVTLTLPSGNAIGYGYANGKITSLTLNGSTTLLSNVLYLPFGPTQGWTWGNATLAVREYDTDGKVTDVDSAGLRSYAYDDAFRITGIADATDANLSQAYSYDLLDRLTGATGTGLSQSWAYDANGNRATQGGSTASTYTIATASNRITSISGALTRTYGYDSAGNTTSDGTATYTYDDAGRMVSATKAGVTATYTLNALGQRVRKTIGAANTYFVYDEAGHQLGEYDNAGVLIQETVWFGDIPVATLRPNGSGGVNMFYVHTDHLNTPKKITRPSDNAIVWRWDADPFGTSSANQNPSGLGVFVYSLRFPGQYADAETGLHYNYFRDYDPATGRYVQSDPIGLRGGVNTYGYVNADPVSATDPLGLLVRGRGCTNQGWAEIQAAEKKIRSHLEKSCECTPDSAGGCIPCNLRSRLKNALDTSQVNCSMGNDCARGDIGGTSLRIMPGGFTDLRYCGCLALTLYHELLHNIGFDDFDVGPKERVCIGPLCDRNGAGPPRRR